MRAFVLLALLVSACASPPQSAEALRQAVSASRAERFEVRRGHREVAAALHEQVRKCLRGTIYEPTMVVSSRKAELHLHRREAGGGQYVVVADAWPVRRGRTAVQVFAASGYDALVAAVKAWSGGRNAGCPDLRAIP